MGIDTQGRSYSSRGKIKKNIKFPIIFFFCYLNNFFQAEQKLKGTLSGDKNEILFSQFSINYNKEPEMLRKGTILVRRKVPIALPDGGTREKSQIVQQHTDIIGDEFWNENNHLLTIS